MLPSSSRQDDDSPEQQYAGDDPTSHSRPEARRGRQKNPERPNPPESSVADHDQAGIRRQRITRACDQCNSLRTKCDGNEPCHRCTASGLICEYKRKLKKRGKVPRTAQETARDRQSSLLEDGYRTTSSGASPGLYHPAIAGRAVPGDPRQAMSTSHSTGHDRSAAIANILRMHDMESKSADQCLDMLRAVISEPSSQSPHPQQYPGATSDVEMAQSADSVTDAFHAGAMPYQHRTISNTTSSHDSFPGFNRTNSEYADARHPSLAPRLERPGQWPDQMGYGLAPGFGPNPMGAFRSHSPAQFPLPSMPSPKSFTVPQDAEWYPSLRYPVLRPVLPYVISIIPIPLACELIDFYFASSTTAYFHPSSPYVIGSIFRKNTFLSVSRPRACSPALLTSMLWIAAQTSDAPFLTGSIAARGRICQKLLELTINLLRPLVHQPTGEQDMSNVVINGVALGGFGVNLESPMPGQNSMVELQLHAHEASAEVDDIVTYMHLATVISASEYKAASIRWWAVVWSLARELRFGRELPRTDDDFSGFGGDDQDISLTRNISASEETREERRRVWWLAYSVDRHLSLCYNQPLSLLDIECTTLLRPCAEIEWQAGDVFVGCSIPDHIRLRGPGFECTDHSMFGFMTPLMTILGECIDLHFARDHPRLGVLFRPEHEWKSLEALTLQHLNAYAQSLAAFRARHLPENVTCGVSRATLSELQVQTIIVLAYSEHIMQVMHVLLAGRWDPLALLEDGDSWISSESFVTATGHAVDAAQALAPILEYDPELSFMPWFFGIYLLQGSFLLLLCADKLGANATERYVSACERCVRAMEACVVTLNTEYQRNFRRVLRSALAQARGYVDTEEQQMRRKEVLSLYRWTGDGRGLAL